MRILTVTHFFGTTGGGIERVAERLVIELARLGNQVSWLASDASPAEHNQSIETITIRCVHWVERNLGIPFPIPLPSQLGKVSSAITKADVLLIHDCLYLTNIIAFLLAKRAGKSVLIAQHIGDVPYTSQILRTLMKLANGLITRTLLARADQVVFISEGTARHFSNVPFRRQPVIAFNGVDSSVFDAHRLGRLAARASFGLHEAATVVVFAGRFVEKKGLATIRLLAKARPDLTFALAGHGLINPASWNLPNVEVFGRLPSARLAELYRAGDVFLLPSSGEGFPLVVQEALACGLPVLCGLDSANADRAASKFLTGVAVDQTRPDITSANFLDALKKELARESTPMERSLRASFAKERYSWSGVAKVYDTLLNKIARPQSRGSATDSPDPAPDTGVRAERFRG